MIGVLLLCIAFLCFLLAAVGQTVLDQPPHDLVAWGLAAYMLSIIVGAAGPFIARYNKE
jgi:hypothetical protein